MKRFAALLLLLSVILGSTLLLASAHHAHTVRITTPCTAFTDANGDGYCDSCWKAHGCAYVDANGDGICDNCQTAHARCYVDVNGDGYCDSCQVAHTGNCDSVCNNWQSSTVSSWHHGGGRHHGCHW